MAAAMDVAHARQVRHKFTDILKQLDPLDALTRLCLDDGLQKEIQARGRHGIRIQYIGFEGIAVVELPPPFSRRLPRLSTERVRIERANAGKGISIYVSRRSLLSQTRLRQDQDIKPGHYRTGSGSQWPEMTVAQSFRARLTRLNEGDVDARSVI